MAMRNCESCGTSFEQVGPGRPRRYCDAHRPRHGHRRHQDARAALGDVTGMPCSRCGSPIREGQPWDLDHVDGGGPGDYAGPAHASCNRRAGAHKGNAARRAALGRPEAPSLTIAPDHVPDGFQNAAGAVYCKCPQCAKPDPPQHWGRGRWWANVGGRWVPGCGGSRDW